ncbi:hypothetical protein BKI52_23175 [marine bacterium AO1-C]|nr:hypothetical protein BKI52_23175 [marine bacterium AO1-C]
MPNEISTQEEIYALLESSSSIEVIRTLKQLRQEKLNFTMISFLVGMSWFHPEAMIRRRVKYLLFKEASEDFVHFLKGKWRYLPKPSITKVWELMEYLSTHPRIDITLLRRWAYRTYFQHKKLSLEKQKLHYLSSELGAFKHLKELNLSYNHLLTLPPELGKLKKLESLSLAHNQLAILPDQIKKLKKLRKLDLTANQGMNNVPREISQLQNLTTLILNQNKFQDLPLSICGLERLEELNLAYNQLSTLPEECTSLIKLKKLNLSHNKFVTLPLKVLCKLENLSTLSIAGNELSDLPIALKQAPRLRKIHLQNIPSLATKKQRLQEKFAPVKLIF